MPSKKQSAASRTAHAAGKKMGVEPPVTLVEHSHSDSPKEGSSHCDEPLLPPGLVQMPESCRTLPLPPPGLRASGNTSKNRRQGGYVRMNQSICNAADMGAEALLHLIQTRHMEMNLVNFSTALHRLARLSEEGQHSRTSTVSDSRVGQLLACARAALNDKDGHGKARCLSTVAWSIARLGIESPVMMQEIADLALPRVEEFKPYELGILLWSFAKLQIGQAALFGAACKHILLHLDEFGAACLATLVWSLTTAQIPSCANLVRKAADKFALRLNSGSHASQQECIKPVALENMMWGLATLQVHPSRDSLLAIAEATLHALSDFKVHEFTIILWAFARLGVYHERLFLEAARMVEHSVLIRSKMHPQGIANLLWAFARYKERRCSGQFDGAISALLPTCKKLLPNLKPQELGCLLSSLSKFGKSWGEDEAMDQIFVSAAWAGVDTALIEGFSFPSVVSTLTAYARFMGDHRGVAEPCRSFMMQLICVFPRFESRFTPQSLLSILEALPPIVSPSPEFNSSLVVIASAILRSIDSLPLPRVTAAAARLRGEIRNLFLQNEEIAELMQFLPDERATAYAVYDSPGVHAFDPAYDPYLSEVLSMEAVSEEQQRFAAAGFAFDCLAKAVAAKNAASVAALAPLQELGCGSYSWTGCSTKHNLVYSDMMPFPSTTVILEQEPAFASMPETLIPARSPASATLAILQDLSSSSTVYGDSFSIAFEVNSDLAMEICSVKVECRLDGDKYDEYEFTMVTGGDIPNTQVVSLRSVQEGEHHIHITLKSNGMDIQQKKLKFHVMNVAPSSSSPPQVAERTTQKVKTGTTKEPLDIPMPYWVKDLLDKPGLQRPLDGERLVKACAFGSDVSSKSTCLGEASDELYFVESGEE